MAGMGTDESKLVAVLGSRSRQEIHLIDLAYRNKYGKPLADVVSTETSGHFHDVLVNIIQTPDLTDAKYLHNCMAGVGTNEKILNEIMATRDGHEIEKIKVTYTTEYRSGLESMIKGDASGNYENLLLALLNGPRGRDVPAGFVDPNKAAADAQKLYESPSEATFINILGNASHAHIQAIRDMFMTRYGKSINEIIKKNTSGHFEDCLEILVTPRVQYFAETVHKAMKGFGTDDDTLIRVVTTRFGVDLEHIKQAYLQTHNKSLHAAVASETSGNYEKILLDIIGQKN